MQKRPSRPKPVPQLFQNHTRRFGASISSAAISWPPRDARLISSYQHAFGIQHALEALVYEQETQLEGKPYPPHDPSSSGVPPVKAGAELSAPHSALAVQDPILPWLSGSPVAACVTLTISGACGAA